MKRQPTPHLPKRDERLLLHYPMSFPSDRLGRRYQTFITSYTLLREWVGWAETREFSVREREQKKEFRALKKRARATLGAIGVIREAINKLDGDQPLDLQQSRARLYATGLSKAELEGLFDRIVSSLRAPPGDQSSDDPDLRAAEQQLRRDQRQSREAKRILDEEAEVLAFAERLLKASCKGENAEAAKALKDSAVTLCVLLNAAAAQNPNLFGPLARAAPSWPVMLGIHADAQEAATGMVERLKVGADTIYGRLRRDRAYVETTVARTYAREVVETIWMNRLLLPEFRRLVKGLETMTITTGKIIRFVPLPEWLRLVAQLPDFSTATIPQWGRVAREVIRTELPDFHLRPEWSSVRRGFPGREKGRIQNKILYNIVSAMRTIARNEEPNRSFPGRTQISR